VFWRRCRGRLIGKRKWEAPAGAATLGELWDMRWAFGTARDAEAFHDEVKRFEGRDVVVSGLAR